MRDSIRLSEIVKGSNWYGEVGETGSSQIENNEGAYGEKN